MGTNPPPTSSPDRDPFADAGKSCWDAPVSQEPKQDKLPLPKPLERLSGFLRGRETLLWWLHSMYALLFGLAVMWLGSRNFAYIRLILFHITFIWLTSLFLPVLINRSWLSSKWRERMRLVINYFNKNFYQQLLFFLLPIYYASTTFGSRNMLFLILLAISALLSTMDIIYDRYLSVRWSLTALFFTFNIFASINVMLPILWAISNRWALWISAALAFVAFASMLHRLSGLRGHRAKVLLAGAALGLVAIVEIFAPFIPPAPLCLASTGFGTAVHSLQIVNRLNRIPTHPDKIAAVTAIKAPLGLEERVRHVWYLDRKIVFVTSYHTVTGGRKDGYLLWSQITWNAGFRGRVLTVDVETRGGQLIGRAKLRS